MNASELYNIVKDVPKEAWPEWHPKGDPTDIWDAHSLCFCAGYFQVHACAEGHPHPQRGPLPPAIAVMLFEASMMRWLHAKAIVVQTYFTHQDGWGSVQLFGAGCPKHLFQSVYRGNNMIEALAAACKAVST